MTQTLTVYATARDDDFGLNAHAFLAEAEAVAHLLLGVNKTPEDFAAWCAEGDQHRDEGDLFDYLEENSDVCDGFTFEPVELELPAPFAAAPDMLAALEQLLEAFNANANDLNDIPADHAVAMMETAIAKARGEG